MTLFVLLKRHLLGDQGATWWHGRLDIVRPSTKVSAKSTHRQLSNWPVKNTDTHADTLQYVVLVDKIFINVWVFVTSEKKFWSKRFVSNVWRRLEGDGTRDSHSTIIIFTWVVVNYENNELNLSMQLIDLLWKESADWMVPGAWKTLSSMPPHFWTT